MFHKCVNEAKVQKVVIVMDYHLANYAFKSLASIRKYKWQVLLIPSKLTWTLQPLDAYHLAKLKGKLHEIHAEQRIASVDGQQTLDEWLHASMNAMTASFQNCNGKNTFKKRGMTLDPNQISDKVKKNESITTCSDKNGH